jgi:hypothetical protein
MQEGTPSFYRLFCRSHYGAASRLAALTPDSPEAQRHFLQKERFAAAALAFCMKYDENFKMHFWAKVCRQNEDPLPTLELEVKVEGDHFEDLCLSTRAEQFVWVVECKAGAALADKQNPGLAAFAQENHGYGWRLRKKYPRSRLGYIILGANEDLILPLKHPDSQISLVKRDWICLVDNCLRSPMVEDLFATLGLLGIQPFEYMEIEKHLENTRPAENLDSGARGYAFLQLLAEKLALRKSEQEVDIKFESDTSWWFGLAILKPDKRSYRSGLTEFRRRLGTLNDDNRRLGWLGYHKYPDGCKLEIELYPRNSELSSIRRLLKESGAHPQSQEPWEDIAITPLTVQEKPLDFQRDIDWFRRTLQPLGLRLR